MLSLQSANVDGPKLGAPGADRFPGDNNSSFSAQILDISVAEDEYIVKPDCIENDSCREFKSPVCVHRLIVSIWATEIGSTDALSACCAGGDS